MLPWTFLYRFLFFMPLRCTPPISGTLGNMAILYLAFWGSVRCSPQQLHIVDSNSCRKDAVFPHPPTLGSTHQDSYPVEKSAVVLIYIFLMFFFLFSKDVQCTGWLCVTLTQTGSVREERASAVECLCEIQLKGIFSIRDQWGRAHPWWVMPSLGWSSWIL